MKLSNLACVLVLVPCLMVPLSTASFAQGTSGAASLNITPGARADAMGRANVALSHDATSNWWNPAALGMDRPRMFSLMHTQLVPDLADDVYYEYFGYSQNLEGWGGVGVNLIFLTYGKSIATDEEGNERGTFSSYEISPAVSLGTKLVSAKGSDLYGGITLKYVYVSLAPKEFTLDGQAGTGDTFAADLGTLLYMPEFRIPIPFLFTLPVKPVIGVNVQNLGPDISFIDEDQSDPIGRNVKAGWGLIFPATEGFEASVEYDFNKSLIYSDEKPIHNVGGEIHFDLAGGFNLDGRWGYIYDKDGDIIDPTFGFGLGLGQFAFDYASVPQAEGLDRVNKFSINVRW